MNSPSPSEILAARHAAKLTQTKAASLIFCVKRTWQMWEAGDRVMHPAMWLLFLILTEQVALTEKVAYSSPPTHQPET